MAITEVLVIDTDAGGGGGIDLTPYLTEYTVQYPKLWADGTGRNLAGSMKATLIGIYTKLIFKAKNNMAMEQIAQILTSLEKAAVYCKYYDIKTRQMQVEQFYFGDVEAQLTSAKRERVIVPQVSIIAYDKRTI